MSSVCFHSQHGGEAKLQGSERDWLAWVAASPARAYWDLDSAPSFERAEQIMALVDLDDTRNGFTADLVKGFNAAQQEKKANARLLAQHDQGGPFAGRWPQGLTYEARKLAVGMLKLALNLHEGLPLRVAGVRLSSRDVAMNTALAIGSDQLALAAKISGWCKDHCWVDGPDRAWMADIVDTGLRLGVYRTGLWYQPAAGGERKWLLQGWADVTALLRARDDEPVVLSTDDGFPNAEIAGWRIGGPPLQFPPGSWESIPDHWQWEHALSGLRKHRPWAQISPDTLHTTTFGPGITVFDLLAPDHQDRVLAAAPRPADAADAEQLV